ncbi:TetR family transcriptional regulator [Nonomuraea sp. KC401]|uniref:TetR/AcrR family transcriptional regulator n=1 Tax=unclassified Nonomuraea TaxID=2593643 RepID=UPI0010FDF550|nr:MULTISPECIES: TetR/AcrR family transcriptional regulator [unclassified Nonomuraea]NBE91694.1 TetR family transcriptional regulator [Nonomuraea sp. K271]TLF85848.1 TetR family transcriptional regulator [Nonomuraea sp. KC401]
MPEQMGLRERKRRRTRQTLIHTGLRLFAERGYDQATVADICAAAELSPATFYKHFPAKEDLVFADYPERIDAIRTLTSAPQPGESLESLLRRAFTMVLEPGRWSIDADEDAAVIRTRLALTVPALRAIALRWMFDLQHEWAKALREVFPQLDDVTAHAIVGAMVGALASAGRASMENGRHGAALIEDITRALDIAITGLPRHLTAATQEP